MQKLFNNILVPIDFSSASERALGKAVEMANEYHCDIHLLHVVTISPFAFTTMAESHLLLPNEIVDYNEKPGSDMDKLLAMYAPHLLDGRRLYRHIAKGLWNDIVIDMVEEHHIDLLLLGQQEPSLRKRKMIIDPNSIAEASFIPVITVPPGNRRLGELFSIVVPVTDFLPIKKLMYGIYMAQHHRSTIKLLGIENEGDDQYNRKVTHYLNKSFQLIRDNCDVPVEIAITTGTNVADTVNSYAFKNAADLVIVNPGRQSRMPGILASLLGNVLQRYSIPPVLTVRAV